MKQLGIFLSKKEVLWNSDPNASKPSVSRGVKCGADECLCEDGRSYQEVETLYEIVLCHLCRNSGVHIECGQLKVSAPVYRCRLCSPLASEENNMDARTSRARMRSRPAEPTPTLDNERVTTKAVTMGPSHLPSDCSSPATQTTTVDDTKDDTATLSTSSTSLLSTSSSSTSTSSSSTSQSSSDSLSSSSSSSSPSAPSLLSKSSSSVATLVTQMPAASEAKSRSSSPVRTPKPLPKCLEPSETPTTSRSAASSLSVLHARTKPAALSVPGLPAPNSTSSSAPKAKQTPNSKFGNGTLRFFLTKSKNVKMVKLVKVRWDLKPPNIKDRLPPSAARCVPQKCAKLVYSVAHKKVKPRRRQGGGKKRAKNKPVASSQAKNEEEDKDEPLQLEYKDILPGDQIDSEKEPENRVSTNQHPARDRDMTINAREEISKGLHCDVDRSRSRNSRRTNLSKIFKDDPSPGDLFNPAISGIISPASGDCSRLASTPICSSLPPPPLEDAACSLEEIDSELVDLASSLDFDKDDEDSDSDESVLASPLAADKSLAPPPSVPVSCITISHSFRSKGKYQVRLQRWEEGEGSILDLAEYRLLKQKQQAAISTPTIQLRRNEPEIIEAKSPIIWDLLRLKRRRESAFEAMNKRQKADSELSATPPPLTATPPPPLLRTPTPVAATPPPLLRSPSPLSDSPGHSPDKSPPSVLCTSPSSPLSSCRGNRRRRPEPVDVGRRRSVEQSSSPVKVIAAKLGGDRSPKRESQPETMRPDLRTVKCDKTAIRPLSPLLSQKSELSAQLADNLRHPTLVFQRRARSGRKEPDVEIRTDIEPSPESVESNRSRDQRRVDTVSSDSLGLGKPYKIDWMAERLGSAALETINSRDILCSPPLKPARTEPEKGTSLVPSELNKTTSRDTGRSGELIENDKTPAAAPIVGTMIREKASKPVSVATENSRSKASTFGTTAGKETTPSTVNAKALPVSRARAQSVLVSEHTNQPQASTTCIASSVGCVYSTPPIFTAASPTGATCMAQSASAANVTAQAAHVPALTGLTSAGSMVSGCIAPSAGATSTASLILTWQPNIGALTSVAAVLTPIAGVLSPAPTVLAPLTALCSPAATAVSPAAFISPAPGVLSTMPAVFGTASPVAVQASPVIQCAPAILPASAAVIASSSTVVVSAAPSPNVIPCSTDVFSPACAVFHPAPKVFSPATTVTGMPPAQTVISTVSAELPFASTIIPAPQTAIPLSLPAASTPTAVPSVSSFDPALKTVAGTPPVTTYVPNEATADVVETNAMAKPVPKLAVSCEQLMTNSYPRPEQKSSREYHMVSAREEQKEEITESPLWSQDRTEQEYCEISCDSGVEDCSSSSSKDSRAPHTTKRQHLNALSGGSSDRLGESDKENIVSPYQGNDMKSRHPAPTDIKLGTGNIENPCSKSTICRIRVRQDMFQEKREPAESLEGCEIPASMDRPKEEAEADITESSGVGESRLQPEEEEQLLAINKSEDLKECLPMAARSPPPRILSRRLDYRRQRRHQWRPPLETPPLSSVSAPEKSQTKELITLNLNTECLDPEPPVLRPFSRSQLSPVAWQLMDHQPPVAAEDIQNLNSDNLPIQKLRLRLRESLLMTGKRTGGQACTAAMLDKNQKSRRKDHPQEQSDEKHSHVGSANSASLEESLFYGIHPLRPTSSRKGGRTDSSGRLGLRRYFTTRILTSMYKLARNPLLDRPISFRSYTFDATPLLRMRERQEDQLIVRRRPSKPSTGSAAAKPKTFWKSSKINSRIKTCISNNGTIKMVVDNSWSDALEGEANSSLSKYYKKIKKAGSVGSGGLAATDAPPPPNIKLKIKKKDILEHSQAKIVLKISKRLVKQKYLSRHNKKKKKEKKKKKKNKEKDKRKSPKRMTIKYKNLYGRVIHFAKSLEAEPPD